MEEIPYIFKNGVHTGKPVTEVSDIGYLSEVLASDSAPDILKQQITTRLEKLSQEKETVAA